MGGIVIYRTTKENAMAPGGPVQFDLILDTVVKVPRRIPDPEQTRHVKYRITLKAPIPPKSSRTIADRPSCRMPARRRPPSRSRVPVSWTAHPSQEEVEPQYLRPNALVTSEDTRVRSLAQRVTRASSDPWEKATRINHWVHENIKNKNFKVAFAAANAVAQQPQLATAPSTPYSPRPWNGPSASPLASWSA